MRHLTIAPMILASVLLVSCSDRTPDRTHKAGSETTLVESDKQWSFPPSTEADLQAANARSGIVREQLVLMGQTFRGLNPAGFNSIAAPPLSNLAKEAHSAILPLETVALNPAYTGDAVLNQTTEFRRIFRAYSEGLTLVVKSDIEYASKEGLLKQFWDVITEGCSAEVDGPGCRAVTLASTSSQSAFLVEHYAWELDKKIQEMRKGLRALERPVLAKLIEKKFAAMRLAMKLQNANDDSDNRLSLLYLISNNDYQEMTPEAQNSEGLRRHKLIVDRITAQLPRRLENETVREQLTPYIQSRSIWTRFTFKNQSAQTAAFGSMNAAVDLIKLSCRYFRTNSNMNEAIHLSLSQMDAKGNPGFLKTAEDLAAKTYSVVFANLMLNLSELKPDETLYLVDQVARGHWNSSIAQECWNSAARGKSAEELNAAKVHLFKVVQAYTRLEMLKQVIDTNQFMSQVFEPRGANKSKPSSKEIFFRAIDEARGLTGDWERMIQRIKLLESFVKIAADEGNKPTKSREYKDLDLMLGSIGTNIKLLAVYPNMLVLSYYLAAKEFSIEIPMWYGGTLQLDAEMIINWILGESTARESARPFFNFGNDSKAIKSFENLYSLYYALKTDSFNTFAEGDLHNAGPDAASAKIISEVNFFSEVTKRYVNAEFLALNNTMKDLEERYSGSDSLRDLQRVCAYEQAKQNGHPLPVPYQIGLSLDSLRATTLSGVSAKEVASPLTDLFGSSLASGFLTIRSDLYRKVLFLNAMTEILEEHWKGQIKAARQAGEASKNWRLSFKSEEDMLKKIKSVRSNLYPIYDMIRRYHQFAIKNYRELGHCTYVISRAESSQQLALYAREREFLVSVHGAMAELVQRAAAQPDAKAELEKLYTEAVNGRINKDSATPAMKRVAELARSWIDKPGDVGTFDEMSVSGGYVYSKWNLLLRIRNNLREINPLVVVSTPPVVTEDSNFTNGAHPDNRVMLTLDAGMTADAFVKQILTGSDTKTLVRWWDKDVRNLGLFTAQVDLLAEISSTENTGVFARAWEACAEDPESASCKSSFAKPILDCMSNPQSESCSTAASYKISNAEIIQATFKVAEMVHITPEEEPILRDLNRRAKYSSGYLKDLFLDSREEPSSLLEFPYKQLADLQKKKSVVLDQAKAAAETFNALLSTGADDQRKDEITEVDWTTEPVRELMFLSKEDTVRKITRKLYRPVVVETFTQVKDFEATVECLAQQARAQNPRYLYELDLQDPRPRSGKYLDPFSVSDKGSMLLAKRVKDDFETVMREFNRDTKHVYRARAGDPDFKSNLESQPKKDCPTLLKE